MNEPQRFYNEAFKGDKDPLWEDLTEQMKEKLSKLLAFNHWRAMEAGKRLAELFKKRLKPTNEEVNEKFTHHITFKVPDNDIQLPNDLLQMKNGSKIYMISRDDVHSIGSSKGVFIEDIDDDHLQLRLNEAVQDENYEFAAHIRDVAKKRNVTTNVNL